MKSIDKLSWLHIRDKRLLGARSKGKETIYIPGGKREPGESDHLALIREIREELSIDLVPSSMEYAGVFTAQAHDKPEGVMVSVSCYFAEFTGEIRANAEIEEVVWLSQRDQHRCSEAARLILDWLKSKGWIE